MLCALLNHRAIFDAGTAAGAQIHVDAGGALFDFDLEVAGVALDAFKIRVGDQFDVQMPADLDQYGGDNSHRTVVGGKCLVQLGHDPANRRGLFEKVDIISRVRQIQRTLHAGDAAADHQYGTHYILGHLYTLLSMLIHPVTHPTGEDPGWKFQRAGVNQRIPVYADSGLVNIISVCFVRAGPLGCAYMIKN